MQERKIRMMVIGATGFVGKQLIELLVEKNVEIVAAVERSILEIASLLRFCDQSYLNIVTSE